MCQQLSNRDPTSLSLGVCKTCTPGSLLLTAMKLTSRRAIGVGVLGLAAATSFQYSQPNRFVQPVVALKQEQQARMSTTAGATIVAPSPQRAVNLRDIGNVDNRLRKGVLYRCSQIYTPDVLKELKIKTVVDLRGRAEGKKKKRTAKEKVVQSLTPEGMGMAQGMPPPPEPTSEQMQALQDNDSPEATDDFMVKTLRHVGSIDSMSSADLDEAGAQPGKPTRAGSSSSDNGSGGAVKKVRGTEELQAGLSEEDHGLVPEVENFNLIPTKEFGLAMLRMPWQVWKKSLVNLATFKDARRPFVDAFADNQLLGFTKYYIIILEHAKKSIAGVMRVFAKSDDLPALVHCAHGKDRTGVVIMLLLMLAGVPHESIVQDYVQSEVELRKYRDSLNLPDPSGASGAVIPLTEVIIASTQETLRAVLSYMDSTYITVDNYLQSCGLTTQEIEAIRNNLLRPGAPVEAPAGDNRERQLTAQEAQEKAEAAIRSEKSGKSAATASVVSGDEL